MMYTRFSSGRNRSAFQKSKSRRAAVLLAAASAVLAGRSQAATYYLNRSGTSDWNSGSDGYDTWKNTTSNTNATLPPIGSIVNVLQAGSDGVANATVTMNYAYTGTGLVSLLVDSSNLITQSSATSTLISGSVYVGCLSGSSGGTYSQSGGTVETSVVCLGVLSNGTNAASLGTYNLSSNATLVLSTNSTGTDGEYIGLNGNGIFNQTGGSNSTTNFYIGTYGNGSNPASLGIYNLSNGGTLSVSGTNGEYIGLSGDGVFNQTGGSNSAVNLYIGTFTNSTGPAAVGNYNLSNGATLSGSECVGFSGTGVFKQTGGSNVTNSLFIAYASTASGTYSLSGGVLTSTSTVNAGQFTQSGGTAGLGTVTGTGTMTLGGSTELTTAVSFQQSTINISSSGGYFAVASNTTRYTNTATSLTITGSGRLDLANNSLITSTSPATIRQYLIAGYNGGVWNGTGGISSISANASYNIPASNGGHLTALGYTSGTSAAGMALGLATNQTLVKYTIYGDANLDGKVDINDLDIVLSNYLSTNAATWDTGDFYYAGQTEIGDLNVVLSNYFDTAPTTVRAANAAAKFKASTASTAKTLTGTVSPADTVSPPPANGVLELVVNTTSGDVELEGNNADIASLQITSASSSIITANWTDLHANGYTNWSDTAKKKTGIGEYDNQFTATGDYAVLGVVDYGDIYNTTVNAEDYVFKYGSVESNDTTVDTDTGSVIYVQPVPEPTTLGLMGLAAAGLMGRRRKSKQPR